MKNITPSTNTASVSPKVSSKGIALAAIGLPALMLAFGLSASELPESEVIVAGGTEIQVTDNAATQECMVCPPICDTDE